MDSVIHRDHLGVQQKNVEYSNPSISTENRNTQIIGLVLKTNIFGIKYLLWLWNRHNDVDVPTSINILPHSTCLYLYYL